jgi:hypothetical protein
MSLKSKKFIPSPLARLMLVQLVAVLFPPTSQEVCLISVAIDPSDSDLILILSSEAVPVTLNVVIVVVVPASNSIVASSPLPVEVIVSNVLDPKIPSVRSLLAKSTNNVPYVKPPPLNVLLPDKVNDTVDPVALTVKLVLLEALKVPPIDTVLPLMSRTLVKDPEAINEDTETLYEFVSNVPDVKIILRLLVNPCANSTVPAPAVIVIAGRLEVPEISMMAESKKVTDTVAVILTGNNASLPNVRLPEILKTLLRDDGLMLQATLAVRLKQGLSEATEITGDAPLLVSIITSSDAVGTDAPLAPPDVADQLVVEEASHVPFPPTQYLEAII